MQDKVKFCLDTSCLIESSNRFYAFDILPRFWDLLLECCNEGIILIPEIVLKEIEKYEGKDELLNWLKNNKNTLLKKMPPETFEVYADISNYVYVSFKEDKADEFLKSGDPLIVSYAKVTGSIVVTQENYLNLSHSIDKNDGKFNVKVKIPNICEKFRVKYQDLFDMLRDLRKHYNKNL